MKTTARKSVKVTIENDNIKYMEIFEVVCKKHNGERVTYGFYLSEKEADETAEWVTENMKELYTTAFTRQQMVWC